MTPRATHGLSWIALIFIYSPFQTALKSGSSQADGGEQKNSNVHRVHDAVAVQIGIFQLLGGQGHASYRSPEGRQGIEHVHPSIAVEVQRRDGERFRILYFDREREKFTV